MEGKRIDQERVVPTRCPECEGYNFEVLFYKEYEVDGKDDGSFVCRFREGNKRITCVSCGYQPAAGKLYNRLANLERSGKGD